MIIDFEVLYTMKILYLMEFAWIVSTAYKCCSYDKTPRRISAHGHYSEFINNYIYIYIKDKNLHVAHVYKCGAAWHICIRHNCKLRVIRQAIRGETGGLFQYKDVVLWV